MKNFIKIFLLLIFTALAVSPIAVNAAEQVKSVVVMKEGSKVHLFHSGTADVKKLICLNDVIPVYAYTATGYKGPKVYDQVRTSKEVGKVKVLSYVGDHHFEAVVVEGQVSPGDVAKKETAYCLVQEAE